MRNQFGDTNIEFQMTSRKISPGNNLHTRYPSIQCSNVGVINPNNTVIYSDLWKHIKTKPLRNQIASPAENLMPNIVRHRKERRERDMRAREVARRSPPTVATELRQYGAPSSGLAGGAEAASRLQKATVLEPSGGSKVSDSQAYVGLDLAAMLGDKISHDAGSSSGRSRGDE